jgi:hypothetical protein
VITIPKDYSEKTGISIVPICIDDFDRNGCAIDARWIEVGVAPVADQLRGIAKKVLSDVWRVSEITDHAVQSVWRRHRGASSEEVSLRIVSHAHWWAKDLKVGGRRARLKRDVGLFPSTVESLREQFDLVVDVENRDIVDRLVVAVKRQGMDDVAEMIPMMLRDADAAEMVQRFGKRRNTLAQRFYRGVRKAAQTAMISW